MQTAIFMRSRAAFAATSHGDTDGCTRMRILTIVGTAVSLVPPWLRLSRDHPSYFLNSSAALVPPKPNEFDSA